MKTSTYTWDNAMVEGRRRLAQREHVLEKLVAALKPGGTLLLEEPDMHPTATLDDTGWHDVTMRVLGVVRPRGRGEGGPTSRRGTASWRSSTTRAGCSRGR